MYARRTLLESGAYTPAEASTYLYGTKVPNQVYLLKRRLAELKQMPDSSSTSDNPGQLFQDFLTMQNDPAALFNATAKMPTTPFGNLAAYASQPNSL